MAVSGHYAYVACYDSGLHIVSVADPAQPAIVGHCETRGKAVGVSVDASYAYVAASDSGLRIISVADPTHPVEVGQCQVARSANAVAADGDFAYVGDSYGLAVISVADPAHPYTASGYLFSAPVLAVAVTANRACVTVRQEAMHVFSVDDSARISHLGQYGYYNWARGSAIDREYVYVAADEDGLRVISIADPENPVQVAFYDVPDWWANGVTTAGGYVYVAYGMAGLQIFQALGGVEEGSKPQTASNKPATTVVRRLPTGTVAFDALGRRALSPRTGVHFVRQARAQAQAVTKAMVVR